MFSFFFFFFYVDIQSTQHIYVCVCVYCVVSRDTVEKHNHVEFKSSLTRLTLRIRLESGRLRLPLWYCCCPECDCCEYDIIVNFFFGFRPYSIVFVVVVVVSGFLIKTFKGLFCFRFQYFTLFNQLKNSTYTTYRTCKMYKESHFSMVFATI